MQQLNQLSILWSQRNFTMFDVRCEIQKPKKILRFLCFFSFVVHNPEDTRMHILSQRRCSISKAVEFAIQNFGRMSKPKKITKLTFGRKSKHFISELIGQQICQFLLRHTFLERCSLKWFHWQLIQMPKEEVSF